MALERRRWGPQGRAAAAWWRAVARAAVRYSETDTTPEADLAFESNRTALATAIVRWAFGLPLDAPVTFPIGVAGRGRWAPWWAVTEAAHGYADVLELDPATVAELDQSVWRLTKAAMRWAVHAAVFTTTATATRIAAVTENGRPPVFRALEAAGGAL